MCHLGEIAPSDTNWRNTNKTQINTNNYVSPRTLGTHPLRYFEGGKGLTSFGPLQAPAGGLENFFSRASGGEIRIRQAGTGGGRLRPLRAPQGSRLRPPRGSETWPGAKRVSKIPYSKGVQLSKVIKLTFAIGPVWHLSLLSSFEGAL
jgi:hypothetical protein